MTFKKGAIYDAMCAEAIARYPEEACGLIIAKGKRSKFIPCKNIAENPRRDFMIHQEDYDRAADEGEVIGVWHTHPNKPTRPSAADRAGMELTGVPWHIMSVHQGENGLVVSGPDVHMPDGFKMPLLERPYVYGVFDCYTLVVDYYKEEFGMTLPPMPHTRIPRFWEKGLNLMEQEYGNAGFVRIFDQEPKKGDLFLTQDGAKCPNHVLIYIGDDMIMHHPQDRLSMRGIYGGGYWQKHTTHHLRHKDML